MPASSFAPLSSTAKPKEPPNIETLDLTQIKIIVHCFIHCRAKQATKYVDQGLDAYFNNYSPVEVASGGFTELRSGEVRKYPTLATSTSVNSCFSIY